LLEGIPAEEGPSLVHGDLWTGNVVYDVEQRPSLIDPGAYWGHREVDLAMLGLFGNPGPGFQEGYDTVFPRVAGWQERVPVYNSYHAWNHGLLFGQGYAPMIEAHARAVIKAR
jgi:fructosamine-3-kinase